MHHGESPARPGQRPRALRIQGRLGVRTGNGHRLIRRKRDGLQAATGTRADTALPGPAVHRGGESTDHRTDHGAGYGRSRPRTF